MSTSKAEALLTGGSDSTLANALPCARSFRCGRWIVALKWAWRFQAAGPQVAVRAADDLRLIENHGCFVSTA
jgi:hypothetical protein